MNNGLRFAGDAQPLGHGMGGFLASAWHQNDKLLTTVAGRQVTRAPHHLREDSGDLRQTLVTLDMAQYIVIEFETINVGNNHGQGGV